MGVSEIRVKRIRVNQGLGVQKMNKIGSLQEHIFSILCMFQF